VRQALYTPTLSGTLFLTPDKPLQKEKDGKNDNNNDAAVKSGIKLNGAIDKEKRYQQC